METIFLLIILGIFLLIVASSVYLSTLVFLPKVLPVQKTYEIEVEKGKINQKEFQSWEKQDVCIPSPFGYQLQGLYFPIKHANRTIILTHGIKFSLYGMVKYMPLFRKRGFNILAYDLRNHGRSGGKNTTFGFYEKYDLKAVMDWAFDQIGPNGLVGTMGESMGAAISLQHAAIDPRTAFVISDCSFSDLTSQISYLLKVEFHLPQFPFIMLANLFCKLATGMSFNAVSPLKDVQSMETPVFFIHSLPDTYIPASMSVLLFGSKLHGQKKLYLSPDGDHAEAYWKNKEAYDSELSDFLKNIGVIQNASPILNEQ
jgi:fermentation-respiration switch protein FrsA (DUF1100 family)